MASPLGSAKDPLKALKDQVHEVLKKKKIKLWLEPYITSSESKGDDDCCCETALEALLEEWRSDQDVSADIRSKANAARLFQLLQEFQGHSLAKYREQQQKKLRLHQSPTSVVAVPRLEPAGSIIPSKMNLQIKILGFAIPTKELSALDFADRAEFIDKKKSSTTTKKTSSVVLRLEGLSTERTPSELVSFLQTTLEVSHVRLIYRGKSISGQGVAHPTLGKIIFEHSNDVFSKDAFLLCIASTVSLTEDSRAMKQRDLDARIAAIREAALQLRDTTNVEITDQHGKLVAMSKEDKLAFLTALALHRLGRNCKEVEDALVFYLEADASWNSHPNLRAWTERVDNYGLLQLDIAWSYLRVESLSNLPDSLRRLEDAERVLRKQVNVNFITLAVTQSDLGNYKEVPPLAAVFAKLFLLQGVALLYNSSSINKLDGHQKARERLDWAFSLLQSLRTVAPEDSIQSLMDAMGNNDISDLARRFGAQTLSGRFIDRATAIAALRKSRGDLNAAANALAQDAMDRRQRQVDRETQRRYGICQNKKDPLDLERLKVLEPMLERNGNTDTKDLAVGLLRLADNGVNRAWEIYHEQQNNEVKIQGLVDALDQQLVEQGLQSHSVVSRKKRRRIVPTQPQVDEEALATLLSMGVDFDKARASLQESKNDIEKAQLWLVNSESQQQDSATSSGVPTSNGKAQMGETDDHGQREEGNEKAYTEGAGESADESEEGMHVDTEDEETASKGGEDMNTLEVLKSELNGILEDRDIEQEYLGSSLDEEWALVLKYRPAT